ncbi:MAG: SMC-Scp complex subunit ScpB [Eubacteriaceae bacterium]|nr:SMC-Scp complex subunit ScpB [Eubacteriaceae bacterium]
MEDRKKASIIESILFAMGEPVSINEIAQSLGESLADTKKDIDSLMECYEKEHKGIMIKQINTKYQMCTRPENYEFVSSLLYDRNKGALSQAALETLAIIAYKQPVTRVEIETLRGVKSSSSIQTLIDRNLIKDKGRMDVPGKPILYETTIEFLKYADIRSINELPDYEEFIDGIQENVLEN